MSGGDALVERGAVGAVVALKAVRRLVQRLGASRGHQLGVEHQRGLGGIRGKIARELSRIDGKILVGAKDGRIGDSGEHRSLGFRMNPRAIEDLEQVLLVRGGVAVGVENQRGIHAAGRLRGGRSSDDHADPKPAHQQGFREPD